MWFLAFPCCVGIKKCKSQLLNTILWDCALRFSIYQYYNFSLILHGKPEMKNTIEPFLRCPNEIATQWDGRSMARVQIAHRFEFETLCLPGQNTRTIRHHIVLVLAARPQNLEHSHCSPVAQHRGLSVFQEVFWLKPFKHIWGRCWDHYPKKMPGDVARAKSQAQTLRLSGYVVSSRSLIENLK